MLLNITMEKCCKVDFKNNKYSFVKDANNIIKIKHDNITHVFSLNYYCFKDNKILRLWDNKVIFDLENGIGE